MAVCDQLEDPKLTKKLVKRGVTELVTPGITFNDQLLDQKENNFLAGLTFEKDLCGAAFLDVSTGTFQVTQGWQQLIDLGCQYAGEVCRSTDNYISISAPEGR